MMGVAASGGYYVASACDAIIAHPSTITGSIGVISVFPNVSGLFSKVGVEMKIIKSGELKDAGSPFRDMSHEEQKVFQTSSTRCTAIFSTSSWRNEKIPVDRGTGRSPTAASIPPTRRSG